MSGRTTAEIVANLREWIVWFAHQDTDSTLPAEAADRLEALDAEVEQYAGLVAEVRHLRLTVADLVNATNDARLQTLEAIVDGCPRCSANASLRERIAQLADQNNRLSAALRDLALEQQ